MEKRFKTVTERATRAAIQIFPTAPEGSVNAFSRWCHGAEEPASDISGIKLVLIGVDWLDVARSIHLHRRQSLVSSEQLVCSIFECPFPSEERNV